MTSSPLAAGVNARHLAIRDWLVRFGLRPGMDIYEIGCGVGPVTELILEVLEGSGSLIALDVDDGRAELARSRVAHHTNVSVLTADGVSYDPERRFDAIVLPDVLEHIPANRHPALFASLVLHLRPEGFVFINMPNPDFLAWCHEHRPDLIQLPHDEPVPTRALLAACEPAGLRLHHLETYEVWVPNGDYQAIVLRHAAAAASFPEDS